MRSSNLMVALLSYVFHREVRRLDCCRVVVTDLFVCVSKDAVKKNPQRLIELLRDLFTVKTVTLCMSCLPSIVLNIWPVSRISLVVRRWANIEPEMEFRGYVSNGKLVALSHYYKFLFTPAVAINADRILKSVREFQEAHIKIPLERYVCDFYVDPKTFSATCIELNPWAPNTSSALFSWDELNDLSGAKSYTKFRFLQQPLSNAMSQVSPFWRAVLAIARGNGLEDAKCTPPIRVVFPRFSSNSENSRSLQFSWPSMDLTLMLAEIEKRGYVTGAELSCLGWKLMMSGGNFVAPTILFLLWSLSFKDKSVLLQNSVWKCAKYLVSTVHQQKLDNSVHNQIVWLKANPQ
jgi:hypothetical protein